MGRDFTWQQNTSVGKAITLQVTGPVLDPWQGSTALWPRYTQARDVNWSQKYAARPSSNSGTFHLQRDRSTDWAIQLPCINSAHLQLWVEVHCDIKLPSIFQFIHPWRNEWISWILRHCNTNRSYSAAPSLMEGFSSLSYYMEIMDTLVSLVHGKRINFLDYGEQKLLDKGCVT